MKIEKITVNKTAERPEGIEIEVVVPEAPLEERLLAYLLHPMLVELKRDNRISYDLPTPFKLEHRGGGTFVVSGYNQSGAFYEAPKPIAIVGVRSVGLTFDIIHADVLPRQPGTPAQPAVATPDMPAPAAPATQPASEPEKTA